MKRKDRLLLTFIKNPIPGKVKTRLGKSIGHEAAVEVYKKLLAKTRTAAMEANCNCHLYYGDYVNTTDDWPAEHFGKFLQHPGDLGDRMSQAFKNSFEQGYAYVLIIGSDCPEMNAPLLDEAFDQLEQHDVVIGPATDGGYYLLGMRQYYPLFDNIAWSTDSVLDSTLKKVKEQELRVAQMREMSDLDTLEDLQHYPELI
jgi:rSAM/selenodomain-associated transferase 1